MQIESVIVSSTEHAMTEKSYNKRARPHKRAYLLCYLTITYMYYRGRGGVWDQITATNTVKLIVLFKDYIGSVCHKTQITHSRNSTNKFFTSR